MDYPFPLLRRNLAKASSFKFDGSNLHEGKSGLAALPELTEFDVTHLEITDLVLLNASRKK